MTINKDKLYLLKIAAQVAGDSENIESTFERLTRLVSDKTHDVSAIRNTTSGAPSGFEFVSTSYEAGNKQTPVQKKKQYKPTKGASYYRVDNPSKKIIGKHLDVLRSMIAQHKETKKSPMLVLACKAAGVPVGYNSGVWLQKNGYLEKQGSLGATVWTILKNPDGTPYNPYAVETTVLPAGEAYGYGQKQDKQSPRYFNWKGV